MEKKVTLAQLLHVFKSDGVTAQLVAGRQVNLDTRLLCDLVDSDPDPHLAEHVSAVVSYCLCGRTLILKLGKKMTFGKLLKQINSKLRLKKIGQVVPTATHA